MVEWKLKVQVPIKRQCQCVDPRPPPSLSGNASSGKMLNHEFKVLYECLAESALGAQTE